MRSNGQAFKPGRRLAVERNQEKIKPCTFDEISARNSTATLAALPSVSLVADRSAVLIRGSLRFPRGCLSFAWPFPSLGRSSVTNSSDFLLLFGGGRVAPVPFLPFLTQLLLVQIALVLFVGKTTA